MIIPGKLKRYLKESVADWRYDHILDYDSCNAIEDTFYFSDNDYAALEAYASSHGKLPVLGRIWTGNRSGDYPFRFHPAGYALGGYSYDGVNNVSTILHVEESKVEETGREDVSDLLDVEQLNDYLCFPDLKTCRDALLEILLFECGVKEGIEKCALWGYIFIADLANGCSYYGLNGGTIYPPNAVDAFSNESILEKLEEEGSLVLKPDGLKLIFEEDNKQEYSEISQMLSYRIHIHRDGLTHGPYSEEKIFEFLEAGHASPADLTWESECYPNFESDEWLPLGELLQEVPEMSKYLKNQSELRGEADLDSMIDRTRRLMEMHPSGENTLVALKYFLIEGSPSTAAESKTLFDQFRSFVEGIVHSSIEWFDQAGFSEEKGWDEENDCEISYDDAMRAVGGDVELQRERFGFENHWNGIWGFLDGKDEHSFHLTLDNDAINCIDIRGVFAPASKLTVRFPSIRFKEAVEPTITNLVKVFLDINGRNVSGVQPGKDGSLYWPGDFGNYFPDASVRRQTSFS